MFDKVIVGIDGSSGGRDALALAGELTSDGGEIALTHVYIESQLPARGSPGVFQAGERRYSRELLEAARSDSGLDAKLCPVQSASIGRGLHQLAEWLGADLVVVGSSRRGLLGRVAQGDDTRAALNAAPCAVAIAPTGYAERPSILAEIGVGYDGSPESQHALSVARELAATHGARVSAFQAVSLPLRAFVVDTRHSVPDLEALKAAARRCDSPMPRAVHCWYSPRPQRPTARRSCTTSRTRPRRRAPKQTAAARSAPGPGLLVQALVV
jgi:nucleotide-binding universal stress UspA family protein